ncbi:SDR family oxidoreductase [Nocardioides sp. TRM66260-LWL]|uniref:enoyl-ACP reductase FabI n=1 Tax=Nocardioides sp. TRM66260-LWL TaxID=2874478 RepID=UPI001CC8109D|nr:SDR family oxidoreductase [Nocardioides sp. TRM66260-LWL]MBZ5735294.1 SDR family oxidoreductase [Nocardioides sp. TRM66260-LWL]
MDPHASSATSPASPARGATAPLLADRVVLVTGVVTQESIAYGVARRATELGAEVVLTGLERDLDKARDAAASLGIDTVISYDATQPEAGDAVVEEIRERHGRLDAALHAIAFAPRIALSGSMLGVDPVGLEKAFRTSTVSYAETARILQRLAPASGGSLVGLDFDAVGAWSVYNWMGVCKAGLEALNRYLARDLGAVGIRSNLVAAGPIHTRAAGGIPGFDELLDAWAERSPLPWDPRDTEQVADSVCFLFSDLARAVTGEILHVDGGYHAMAAPLRRVEQSAPEA